MLNSRRKSSVTSQRCAKGVYISSQGRLICIVRRFRHEKEFREFYRLSIHNILLNLVVRDIKCSKRSLWLQEKMKNSDMTESKWEQWWVYTNALKSHMVGKTAFPLLLRTDYSKNTVPLIKLLMLFFIECERGSRDF